MTEHVKGQLPLFLDPTLPAWLQDEEEAGESCVEDDGGVE